MAVRRKSKKKKGTSRRRKVSGLAVTAKNPIVLYGSMIGGYLFGDQINTALDKVVDPTKVDPKIIAGGQVGLGSAYLFLMKGKKNVILTVASGAMIGAGIKRGMKEFGIGAMGAPALNVYQKIPSVNGYQNVKSISNYNPSNSGMGYNASKVAVGGRGLLRTRRAA